MLKNILLFFYRSKVHINSFDNINHCILLYSLYTLMIDAHQLLAFLKITSLSHSWMHLRICFLAFLVM